MVWVRACAPPALSKLRSVTPEQLSRQAKTATALALEADVLESGGTVPVPKRSRKGVAPGPPPCACLVETAELRTFLGLHGHAISGLLAHAETEADRIALARGYREIVTSKPGAHERWTSLVRRLSV
jgi:hypothetical protein